MLRHCLGVKVDWHDLTKHKPIEYILNSRDLFFTARVLGDKLRAHGHWIRQHYRVKAPAQLPIIDVYCWDFRLHEEVQL